MAAKRIFNWVLNIISVACVGFVIWQLVHNHFSSSRSPGYTGMVGSKVKLANISWTDSPKTVVLALSTQCQYCKMSADFYRSLIVSARPERFRVIAALRKSAQDWNAHPTELGIEKLRDVLEADLGALGIRVTPTVLVVNGGGTVEAAWAGKLTAAQERDVFVAVKTEQPLQSKKSALPDASLINVQVRELRALLRDSNTVLLDTRERSRFYEAHIPGSLNMPIDEIVPRAPHELPEDRTIVMYCVEYSTGCSVEKSKLKFISFGCEASRRMLEYVGITKVRAIADDLGKLAEGGIPVKGKPCR